MGAKQAVKEIEIDFHESGLRRGQNWVFTRQNDKSACPILHDEYLMKAGEPFRLPDRSPTTEGHYPG
jgi:hypothetical protein